MVYTKHNMWMRDGVCNESPLCVCTCIFSQPTLCVCGGGGGGGRGGWHSQSGSNSIRLYAGDRHVCTRRSVVRIALCFVSCVLLFVPFIMLVYCFQCTTELSMYLSVFT